MAVRRFTLLLTGCMAGSAVVDDGDTDTDPRDTEGVDTDLGESDDTDDPGAVPCPDDLGHAVSTTSGCVVGTTNDFGEAFLGIPYAKPPVGSLRWRPPEPHPRWDAPRQATAFGDVCPQSSGTLDGDLQPGDGREDCLTLNVFRPEGAEDLPILFFTHGGGHADGSGSQDVYGKDPELAGGAVVVTHNYRLGALGFLAHPALSAESAEGVSGNYGLMDTLLALRWVVDNAEALGGDPDRVLIFGESAGGLSSCALWASPEADGLYDAVLTQSAPCWAVRRPLRESLVLLESGEDQGERFAAAVGCDGIPSVAACLRALSVDAVLQGLPARQGTLGDGESYDPVIDGVLLPRSFEDALAAGALPDVPFFAGANGDEGSVLAGGVPVPTEQSYRILLAGYSLVVGTSLQTLYDTWDPADFGGSYAKAFQAFYGDFAFVCSTRRLLEATAGQGILSRGYYFERGRPLTPGLGAYHGVELPFVFGTLPLAGAADQRLSDDLQEAWTDAAGAPAVKAGDVTWPAVTEGWLHVGADASVGTVGDVRAERCGVLWPE